MRRQDLPGLEIAKEYCGTEATTVTLARKYDCSPSLISRVLQEQMDYDRFKRVARTKQSARAKRSWQKRWSA
jgi:transposase-like protein